MTGGIDKMSQAEYKKFTVKKQEKLDKNGIELGVLVTMLLDKYQERREIKDAKFFSN